MGKKRVVRLALRRQRPKVRFPAAQAHRVLADEAAVVEGMIEGKFLQHAISIRRVKRVQPRAVVVAPHAGEAALVGEYQQAIGNFFDLVSHLSVTILPERADSIPAARSENTLRLWRPLNGGAAPPSSQARQRAKNSSHGLAAGRRASIAIGLNAPPRGAKS